jgi:hypothetical protein
MSYDYEEVLMETLIENDIDTIFNSPSGMAYLTDILNEVYSNLSTIELVDEMQTRGLELPELAENI